MTAAVSNVNESVNEIEEKSALVAVKPCDCNGTVVPDTNGNGEADAVSRKDEFSNESVEIVRVNGQIENGKNDQVENGKSDQVENGGVSELDERLNGGVSELDERPKDIGESVMKQLQNEEVEVVCVAEDVNDLTVEGCAESSLESDDRRGSRAVEEVNGISVVVESQTCEIADEANDGKEKVADTHNGLDKEKEVEDKGITSMEDFAADSEGKESHLRSGESIENCVAEECSVRGPAVVALTESEQEQEQEVTAHSSEYNGHEDFSNSAPQDSSAESCVLDDLTNINHGPADNKSTSEMVTTSNSLDADAGEAIPAGGQEIVVSEVVSVKSCDSNSVVQVSNAGEHDISKGEDKENTSIVIENPDWSSREIENSYPVENRKLGTVVADDLPYSTTNNAKKVSAHSSECNGQADVSTRGPQANCAHSCVLDDSTGVNQSTSDNKYASEMGSNSNSLDADAREGFSAGAQEIIVSEIIPVKGCDSISVVQVSDSQEHVISKGKEDSNASIVTENSDLNDHEIDNSYPVGNTKLGTVAANDMPNSSTNDGKEVGIHSSECNGHADVSTAGPQDSSAESCDLNDVNQGASDNKYTSDIFTASNSLDTDAGEASPAGGLEISISEIIPVESCDSISNVQVRNAGEHDVSKGTDNSKTSSVIENSDLNNHEIDNSSPVDDTELGTVAANNIPDSTPNVAKADSKCDCMPESVEVKSTSLNGNVETAGCNSQDGEPSVTKNESVTSISVVNGEASSEVETIVTSSCEIISDDGHMSPKCKSSVTDGSVVLDERNSSCIADDLHAEDRDLLVGIDVNEKSCQDPIGSMEFHGDHTPTSSQEGSTVDASNSQDSAEEVVKRPFYYMIRVPRYDDGYLKEQIQNAQMQVSEKTKLRDAFRGEIQTTKNKCKEYGDIFRAAVAKEKAARELLKANRKEIDAAQSVISRVKNVLSFEDIDAKIRSMEHMIQHETLPLKEEKHIIRELKQLKQLREQQSSTMGSQDDIKDAMDQKDKVEERIKVLRKEAGVLRDNLLKAEVVTKDAKEKYRGANNMLIQLSSQYKAADAVRQEAYAHLQSLRKQSYDKSKHFWQYKDDFMTANDMTFKGNKEELQKHCINQVDRFMELWNNDEEFRKDYIKCNLRSTLRRLKTYDGRSLGPDEEPPALPNVSFERNVKGIPVPSDPTSEAEESGRPEESKTEVAQRRFDSNERLANVNSVVANSTRKIEESSTPGETEKRDVNSAAKAAEQKIHKAKHTKPTPRNDLLANSWLHEIKGTNQEDLKQLEEEAARKAEELQKEEEAARKAEELRKEEEAARLKEQERLEHQKRSIEGMEKKKLKDEKAREKAIEKAKKEAEKNAEKKAKKGKKKALADETNNSSEGDTAPSSEPKEAEKRMEQESAKKGKKKAIADERNDSSKVAAAPSSEPTTVEKKLQKRSHLVRQTKAAPMPLPLRNRGKKKFKTWMWAILIVVIAVALFFIGNSHFLTKLGEQWLGF